MPMSSNFHQNHGNPSSGGGGGGYTKLTSSGDTRQYFPPQPQPQHHHHHQDLPVGITAVPTWLVYLGAFLLLGQAVLLTVVVSLEYSRACEEEANIGALSKLLESMQENSYCDFSKLNVTIDSSEIYSQCLTLLNASLSGLSSGDGSGSTPLLTMILDASSININPVECTPVNCNPVECSPSTCIAPTETYSCISTPCDPVPCESVPCNPVPCEASTTNTVQYTISADPENCVSVPCDAVECTPVNCLAVECSIPPTGTIPDCNPVECIVPSTTNCPSVSCEPVPCAPVGCVVNTTEILDYYTSIFSTEPFCQTQ